MFKVKHDLCPELSNIFIRGTNCRCNLRYRKDFKTSPVKSAYYGTECITYLGPKMWDIFPEKFRKKTDSAKLMRMELVLLRFIN